MDNTPVLVAVIVGFGGTIFTVIGAFLQLNKRFDDVTKLLVDHVTNTKVHQEHPHP